MTRYGIVGVLAALALSVALGITAPFYSLFHFIQGLFGLLFLIWQAHPKRVIAIAFIGYFASIIFNSMRHFDYRSFGFDPFTQFVEDKPFGSADFADTSDLSSALNGNTQERGPEFKE